MEMKLLGSNFTKLSAERKPDFSGKLEITSDIKIKSIEKFKPKSVKDESLKIVFSFTVDYKELGKVEIQGILFIGAEQKHIKEIIKKWEDKNMDDDVQIPLINLIVQKSSIKAIQLEEELGLPIHIKLPSLSKAKN